MSKKTALEAEMQAAIDRVEASFESLMKLEAEMHQRRMDAYADMRISELERIQAEYGLVKS